MKCPNCHSDNPDTQKFCGECATPLPLSRDIPVTKTLETPTDKLTSGITFAGRYNIIEELGKGGMGRVYLVRDEKLDEEIAIKVLKPEIAADKSMIERFKNELKLARKIAHKSICKMYDLNEEEDTPYITMEYVPGKDLKSFIREKGKLSEEETIAIAKQVCEGLAEAHELGVIHRDLKPQNIMIDEKSNAKVMDFGIARSVEAPGITHTGMMIGTPDYISPEQAEGEEADQRSDIYALGVILYEMVTGRVPFKGDTALSVALKHKAQLPKEPRKLNPEVSESLNRLILICMEKDRERRYQKAEELLADLRNIEDGFPLGTKIQPRRETFAAVLIRKKLFIPALAVALIIAALIVWQPWSQKKAILIPSDEPSLAIMYFKNNTGDENLDFWREALSDSINTDLSQSKFIKVLSSASLYDILKKLNLLEAQSYSSEDLMKVAVEGRVNHILLGGLFKAGDNFRIEYGLHEIIKGKIIGSDRVEGVGEESIFSMVDELSKKIKLHLNLSREQMVSDLDELTAQVTTSSIEAYKHYIDGIKHYRRGDWLLAIPLLKKAVAIDPEFAKAYRNIGTAYSNAGYSADKDYAKIAFELRDRLPLKERLEIEAVIYGRSDKTYPQRFNSYIKLTELSPESAMPYINIGWGYYLFEQWDKAIEYTLPVRKFDPDNMYAPWNLRIYYGAEGSYKKAQEILESYLNNVSDNHNIRRELGVNFLLQRKFDLALSEVEKALALDPNHYLSIRDKGIIYHLKGDFKKAQDEYQKLLEYEERNVQYWGELCLAGLYSVEGKFNESIGQLEQIIQNAARRYLINATNVSAYLKLKSGKHQAAIEECNKALGTEYAREKIRFQFPILNVKGLIHVDRHELDVAHTISQELKTKAEGKLYQKFMRYYFHLMGMIELKKENYPGALDFFKEALHLSPYEYHQRPYIDRQAYFIEPLALTYYKMENYKRAKREYQRITELTTGRLYFSDIYAKAFYMLGKIFEEQGKKRKAIEHYQNFLDLWKDAEPGIAEVEDAKKRLAGLKQ